MLDCSPVLTAKATQPGPTVSVPYLYNGPDLSFDYLSFFDETPIASCAILGCNVGDTCGDATTISELNNNIVQASSTVSPYEMTYLQSFKDGYGPHSLCV